MNEYACRLEIAAWDLRYTITRMCADAGRARPQ